MQRTIIICETAKWWIYKRKYGQLTTIPWVLTEEFVGFCCFSEVGFSRREAGARLPAQPGLAHGSAVPSWLVPLQLLRSLLGAGTGCLLSWAYAAALAPVPLVWYGILRAECLSDEKWSEL